MRVFRLSPSHSPRLRCEPSAPACHSGTRSALAVSHGFAGLLHTRSAGLLHPAADHGVRLVAGNGSVLTPPRPEVRAHLAVGWSREDGVSRGSLPVRRPVRGLRATRSAGAEAPLPASRGTGRPSIAGVTGGGAPGRYRPRLERTPGPGRSPVQAGSPLADEVRCRQVALAARCPRHPSPLPRCRGARVGRVRLPASRRMRSSDRRRPGPKPAGRPSRRPRFTRPKPCFSESVRSAAPLSLPRPSLRRGHPSKLFPRPQPRRVTATLALSTSLVRNRAAVSLLPARRPLAPSPRVPRALLHARVRCFPTA